MPDYSPPFLPQLARITETVDEAKRQLLVGDRMVYADRENHEVEFNLSVHWAADELSEMGIRERVKFENMPMTLIVKKPDYLGQSQWDFRHGRLAISARIKVVQWLQRFQLREIDVRPGDALRCLVTIERRYGYDNELIDEDHTITKVDGVVENHTWRGELKPLSSPPNDDPGFETIW
jgi:hypothetical protein